MINSIHISISGKINQKNFSNSTKRTSFTRPLLSRYKSILAYFSRNLYMKQVIEGHNIKKAAVRECRKIRKVVFGFSEPKCHNFELISNQNLLTQQFVNVTKSNSNDRRVNKNFYNCEIISSFDCFIVSINNCGFRPVKMKFMIPILADHTEIENRCTISTK